MTKRRGLFMMVFLFLIASASLAAPAGAQRTVPTVSVSDQVSTDGAVMIDSVYSALPGFVVIHLDNHGKAGRVAGFAPVAVGWTYQLLIPIDVEVATPVLYATLHVDDGQPGVYEFDGLSGFDNPVIVNGMPVSPAFNVTVLRANDQFVSEDNKIQVASVTIQQDGWLVIYSDHGGQVDAVIGHERVLAGTTHNVEVELDPAGLTEVLHPMLHSDSGAAAEYEFGTVEGADLPIVVGSISATTPIWTVPHVRAAHQIVVRGDGQGAANTSLVVESVLAENPGWLVVHNEQNYSPGPVVGLMAVPAGLSTNLTIENLDSTQLTPHLWLMLDDDTGVIGEYEFGTVADADEPVLVDGSVLTFPINAAPSLIARDQVPVQGEAANTIRVVIDEALIDAPGWLAIHTSEAGAPGAILATAMLHAGLNAHVMLDINTAAAGDQIIAMLHYDTDVVGDYEFGTVEGADPAVLVNGKLLIMPINLLTAEATPTPLPTTPPSATPSLTPTSAPTATFTPSNTPTTVPTANAPSVTPSETATAAPSVAPTVEASAVPACTVTTFGRVNRRAGAATSFESLGQLTAGQTAGVIGQTLGADGLIWWQTDDGSWVRSDVVTVSGACETVPSIPAEPPAELPAATAQFGY